jgi:hypothetical protein
MGFPTYPVPDFLKATFTQIEFGRWLTRKANEARRHDIERKSPFAARYSQKDYRRLVYEAVLAGNGIDPFTGDILRFDLSLTYDAIKARGNIAYEKSFDLMPTVDHVDPDAVDMALEICSWRINFCKSYQNPADFIATCRKVVDYCCLQNRNMNIASRGNEGVHRVPYTFEYAQGASETVYRGARILTSPKRWFLPPYLEGRCTMDQFRRWLFGHAAQLLGRDRKLGRLYALDGCMELYKQIICEAAQNAMYDPFTGELLQWESINRWNPRKKDPSSHSVRDFPLLPTADHVDPASDVLDIERGMKRNRACIAARLTCAVINADYTFFHGPLNVPYAKYIL